MKLAPSILSADFLDLGNAADVVNAHADLFHMDVMDGVMVPNISFGFPIVEAVAKKARKPLDVHLMICSPERYALKFAAIPGVSMVSFHLEAMAEPLPLLTELKKSGVQAGLVVNPDYPLEKLFPFLEACDFVLIMGVHAGFSGQKYIEATEARIAEVKAEITRRKLKTIIEVDGGVSISNIQRLSDAGAEIFVAGSSVFGAQDPASAMDSLKSAVDRSLHE